MRSRLISMSIIGGPTLEFNLWNEKEGKHPSGIGDGFNCTEKQYGRFIFTYSVRPLTPTKPQLEWEAAQLQTS